MRASSDGLRSLPTLRFLACGSVADGKSTLIERLSFDGLDTKREQGTTVDVTYRAFATPRRDFIAIDAPGHEQYTHNMVTAASNADLAVLLIDTRKGLQPQTHQHAAIVSLLGIRHVIVAINKMDLVGYNQAEFIELSNKFGAFTEIFGFESVTFIPVSARHGDNVSTKSTAMDWYGGTSLLEALEMIDITRRDVVPRADAQPQLGNQFAAHLIWMGDEPMHVGRSYLLKLGSTTVPTTVTDIRYRLNVVSLEWLAAKSLHLNEVAVCNLATQTPIAFDAAKDNRAMGGFSLIDRTSNATVAAGTIDFQLRRSENVRAQALTVTKQARADLMGHKPAVVWFTGLSGAGKSTIANLVEIALHARGVHTLLLDGDNVRLGLNKDLGFTEGDRIENIRRVGEVARLMTDAGLIVLCSFISPFQADRQTVRDLLPAGEFIEVFVDVPIATAIKRDPKGLYKRALAGEIRNFTGIDQPYQRPEHPDIVLDADKETPENLARLVVQHLQAAGLITMEANSTKK